MGLFGIWHDKIKCSISSHNEKIAEEYMHVCICMYACMHVCMYMCAFIYICMHVPVCICVCMYV